MGIYKINDPSLERTLKAIRDDDILLNELNAEFRHFKSKDKKYKFNAYTPMGRGQHEPRLKYMIGEANIAIFVINRNTMGIKYPESKISDIRPNDRRIVCDIAGAVAIYAFDIIMALFENRITDSESKNAMDERAKMFCALSDSKIKEIIKQGRNLAEY